MLFKDYPILLRGGGDLATGVAYRLHKAGFPLVVLELPAPLVVRRPVALASAVFEGEIEVEGLEARRVTSYTYALDLASSGLVPVLASPELPDDYRPSEFFLVDARMAKRKLDTRREQARLVIGLGPGFTAGVDCHAVVETMRGHRLGRVIWAGSALPNTGTPGVVAGKGAERVLRAPGAGRIRWRTAIGDKVRKGQVLGAVGDLPVVAPFSGVVRGQIAHETMVTPGLKIGDVDARADVEACFTISDKSLAIGGGVVEAVLTWIGDEDQAIVS